jgi:hypothetical protein
MMGVEFVYSENNITVYVDEYQDDNSALRGRKQDSDKEFLIVSPKVARLLNSAFLKKERKKKLEHLKNVII